MHTMEINETLTLIIVVKSHFLIPLPPRRSSVCDNMWIRVQWAFPFLHPRFSPSVLCVPSPAKEEETKRWSERERAISFHLFIYITHYTLFGPLNLMGQSSELGWAHKKMSNPHYGPWWKNKITLIYDIITLIM